METRKTVSDTIWYSSVISTFKTAEVKYDIVTQDCEQGGNVWMENLQYAAGGTYSELNNWKNLTDYLNWISISIGLVTIVSLYKSSEKLSSESLDSGSKACRFAGPISPVFPLGEPDSLFARKYRRYKLINTRTIQPLTIFNWSVGGSNTFPFTKEIVLYGPCCQVRAGTPAVGGVEFSPEEPLGVQKIEPTGSVDGHD